MKLSKRYLACIFLAVVMVISLGLFVACGDGNNPNDSSDGSTASAGTQSTDTAKTPEELKGEYYCEDGDKEYNLSFADEMAVKLNFGDGNKQAKFAFDGTKATWEVDGKQYSATYAENGNKVNLTVDKSNYTFWKRVEFTVTYEVNGGSRIEPSKALNGKPATKPSDPTKDGYYFAGWYKDAEFKEAYSFESDAITANTTIYAQFLVYFEAEFEVNFDLNYENATPIDAVMTVQNKLQYNLPTPTREGYKFVGWWLSHFNSAEKLTAKYVDQEIKQNTTLYAVWEEENNQTGIYVSVSEDAITWESVGVNVNYTVTVSRPSGEDSPYQTQRLIYEYPLKDATAGEYMVKVESSNGLTGYAYYNNKQLDSVCIFKVDDKTATLNWNPVENATNYKLTYVCGDENHIHENVNVKSSTYYTFKDCDMPKDGFKFIVEASANGYSSSTSEAFTYNKALTKPTNLKVADGTTLTWDAVENAQYYEVYVGETKYTTLTNNVSLQNHSGALEIKVVAKSRTLAESEKATLNYTREKLVTPQNITVNGGQVAWDAVNGATSYVVTVDGKQFTATENSFTLSDTNYDASKKTHTLTVQAKAATEASLSLVSKQVNFTADTVNPLFYEDGKVYWAVVKDAKGYVVKVNDGEDVQVEANKYYADVRLTKAGKNEIKVAFVNAQDVKSAWATLTVEAVALRVDLAGAQPVSEDGYLYFKKGTNLNLNDITAMVKRDGYAFAGWYNKENGRNTNGARYYDDVPLVLNDKMTIYGAWLGKEYKVTLNPEGAKFPEDVTELVYTVRMGDNFKLPVPYLEGDTTKIFMGWYAEPNGEGTQCTYENGNSVRGGYKFYEDRTFYPKWANVFSFLEIASKDPNYDKAYSVSKGEAINRIENVYVPAMYNGYPVTTIEANGFASCSNILSFNIPNTVLNVESTAFKGCYNLQEVNVYDAGSKTPIYYSSQGVLLRKDNLTGYNEIAFVPATKSGTFVIPDGVNVIPNETFKSSKITEITIPATVIYIGKDAFYNTSSTVGFQKITFLPQEEGKDEVPLTLAAGAFNYTKLLTSIDLPARTALIADEGRWFYDIFGRYTGVENVNIVGNPAKVTVKNEDGTETRKEVKTYTSKDGVVYTDNGTTLVYYPLKKAGEFISGTGVTKIDEYAFAYNTAVTKITIAGEVTEIGDYAFLSCSGVLELIFEGVAEYNDLRIGRESFYGLTEIKKLILPGNLKSLGLNAFGGCSDLVSLEVYFDDRVIEQGELLIDENAFANRRSSSASATVSKTTYITTLYLGEHVPVLDINAIFGGSKLKNLSVDPKNPNYGTYQDDGVIYGKDEKGNLENIAFFPATREGEYVVPTGIKTIGALVFNDKDLLTKITIPHTITRIGDDAFAYCNGLKDVIFLETPEGVEPQDLVIGNRVFRSCLAIEKITFPERTTSLGDAVFNSATNLTTVNLPTTLYDLKKTISGTGNDATESMETFYTSTSGKLASINVAEGSKFFTSIDGVLYNLREEKKTVDGKEVIDYVPSELITCPIQNGGNNGSIVIPATVNRIWDKAFYYNKLIKSISFEERTTDEEFKMGKQVFYSATNLANLELPYGLTEIRSGMLYGCATLEQLVIPQTVSLIQGGYSSAFSGCKGLKKIIFLDDGEREKDKAVDLVIGDGSTSSDSYHTAYYGVFRDCVNLETVVFPIRGNKPAIVEEPTEEGGEPIVHPGEKATIKIGTYAFFSRPNYSYNSSGTVYESYQLQKLQEVVLTDNVAEIGNYAFGGILLESIELPNRNITFGTNVFYYAPNLKSMVLPEGVTEISKYMFEYSGIQSITIPSSVETIGSYAFGHCNNLTNVTFAKKEITAEDGTVSYETNLTKIDTHAFEYCRALTTIELPESITTIEGDAFASTGLTSINFPASIETIGYAFYNTPKLTSITFDGTAENPSNLTTIDANAFKDAPVVDVKFPVSNNVINLGATIFGNSKTLKTVYLSESIQNISDVFNGCSALEKITVSDKSEHFSADPNLPLLYNKEGNVIRLSYGEIDSSFTLFNSKDEQGNAISTITEIGDNAFAGQTGITSVIIPKSVITIGDDAFNGCTGMTELIFELGGQLTTIGVRAFKGCTGLTQVQLPASIEYLYDFDGAATTVSGSQFEDCYRLSKVTFAPDSKIKILGNNAFKNCVSLESFEIPETVYRIDNYTFQGAGLKEITLPAILGQNNAKLGGYIFKDCKDLTTVHFPETTQFTSLPNYMFQGCTSLKYSTIGGGKVVPFTLPESVTAIGNYAFDGCTALDTINLGSKTKTLGTYVFRNTCFSKLTLPDTITSIGNYAFLNSAIQEITLPASLTTLGTYVFDGCKELTTVTMSKAINLKKIGSYAFRDTLSLAYSRDENNKLVDFVIPSSINNIDNYAFTNTGLTKITIPETVTTFGDYIFKGALNLVEVDYQATKMGKYMFQNCTGLTTVKFSDKTDSVGANYAFDGCIALQYSEYVSETDNKPFALPEAATVVPQYFLRNVQAIKEITIPASVKEIQLRAFEKASGLETVIFPETGSQLNATTGVFGNYMFLDCTSLKNIVNLPNALKTYGTYMFQNCTSLEWFTIPAGWTKVPSYMFNGCTNLKNVTFAVNASGKSSVTIIDSSSFVECDSLVSITIPDSVVTINSYAFDGCDLLENVTLANPDNVTTLKSYAFRNCVSLKKFVMPKSLDPKNTKPSNTYIFQNCANLESVTFHKDATLEKLPNYMFEGCSSLKTITLPNTITEVGDYVFRNCSSLSSVTFGDINKVIKVGKEVFKGCSSLKSMDLPANLEAIGESTFEDCVSLTTVNIPAGANYEAIPKNTFKGCTMLKSFVLPESVTAIGDSAFEGAGLTSISLPAALTTIGKNAFKDCVNLATVTFNANVITEIPDYAFYNTAKLTKIEVPTSVTKLGDCAFGKSGLTSFDIGLNLTELAGSAFAGAADLTEITVNLSNHAFTYENGMLLDEDGNLVSYLASSTPVDGTITISKDMKIYPKAFAGAKNILTVIFEDGFTAIPEYALYDADSVKSVVIPASVTSIGAYAFAECDSLESVAMSNNVTTLGTKVVDKDGNATYTGYVFANTPMIKNLTLSTGIQEIMPYTFDGSGITAIVLPEALTTICDYGFFNATKLASVTFGANVGYIGKYAFTQCLTLSNVTITGKDMEIADYAFANVTTQTSLSPKYEALSLKAVTLGEGVKSVGIAAFRGAGVETLNVGPTVEILDDYLFYKDETLKNVIFTDNSKINRIGQYTFGYCNGLTEISLPESLEYLGGEPKINSSTGLILSMDGYSFAYCENLATVKLPSALTAIGSYAFRKCISLKEVTVPGCEFYGSYIFQDCENLEKATFAEGAKEVGSSMFRYDAKLKTVVLPNTILEIKGSVFEGCIGLRDLYIPASLQKIYAKAFVGLTNETTVYFEGIYCPGSTWVSTWNDGSAAKFVFDKPVIETQPELQPQPEFQSQV